MDDISQFLNGIEKSISNSKKNLSDASGVLEELDKAQTSLYEVLQKLNRAADQFSNGEFIRENIEIAFKLVDESKSSVFVENTAGAMLLSQEFSHSVFAGNLMEAVRDPNSLRMFLNYSGLESTITVDNNLDEVAGSLEDWGRAVLEVREARGGSRSTPERASKSWAVLFNNRQTSSPWAGIQQRRLSFAGKLAPYWQILDKGHANISLVSDRGGYATPTEAPTNFVSNTITDLEVMFKKELSNIKRSITRAKNKILKQADRARDLLAELDMLIVYVQENMGDVVGEISEEAALTNVVDRITERLSKTKSSIDKDKLKSIVNEVLETGTISSYNITSEGRVEVTASGATSRTRISVSVLLQMIAEG